jgi:quinol monooxygenase YgiN
MSTLTMYAHVNIWMMNDLGATRDDTAARAIAAALREQPGFRSYTLVRSGEWQVIAVTVFESEAALTAAMEVVAPLVHERVAPLATEPPARYGGTVLHHLTA